MPDKHFARIAIALVGVLLGSLLMSLSGCEDRGFQNAPQATAVHGTLYGVVTVPRDSIPTEARPEAVYELDRWYPVGPSQTTVRLIEDGTVYEFRRTLPTDSLTVEVGGQTAQLSPDGSFTADGVPIGLQEVVFKYRGEAYRTQSVTIPAQGGYLSVDVQCEKEECAIHDHGKATTFPCLDNNGVGPGGFYYSDCWMSLFYGPPWYSWMCWSEAMDWLHDHHGNIWCDGSHNCSLFVHGWDWNRQNWHRHSFMWIPRW